MLGLIPAALCEWGGGEGKLHAGLEDKQLAVWGALIVTCPVQGSSVGLLHPTGKCLPFHTHSCRTPPLPATSAQACRPSCPPAKQACPPQQVRRLIRSVWEHVLNPACLADGAALHHGGSKGRVNGRHVSLYGAPSDLGAGGAGGHGSGDQGIGMGTKTPTVERGWHTESVHKHTPAPPLPPPPHTCMHTHMHALPPTPPHTCHFRPPLPS